MKSSLVVGFLYQVYHCICSFFISVVRDGFDMVQICTVNLVHHKIFSGTCVKVK